MAEQLIQSWLESSQSGDQSLVEEERVVATIVTSLDLAAISFADFIKSLTSRVEQEVDLTIAGRALSLLPRVFVALQQEPNRHEVHALIPYLCARLEDASPGLYYISEALQIMVRWTRFAPGDAQEVTRAIFKLGASNSFSSQTAITRLSLYTLVDTLRAVRAAALKRDMSEKEVVQGIVTMAELEKNPSCLRALFTLYADLSRDWALDAEDFKHVFDSYIRYFPVTMKEAPKDPKIPSTTELRDLLLKCFVSNDGYSKPTFAAMIERLDVDSANTKVEVFKTLSSAVQSYSVATISESANKLWDSLKFEIWNGENDQWIQSSLDLLRQTAASLDREPSEWSDKTSPLYSFLIGALAECRDRIKDKPNMYLRTSGRIFNAFASASPYAFYLTSRTVVPIMDTLAQAHASGSERTFVLEVLNGILGARLAQADLKVSLNGDKIEVTPEIQHYQQISQTTMSSTFSSFRDRLLEIYHEGVAQIIKNTDSSESLAHCVPAIKGLELMSGVPSYLSEAEKGMIVGELVQVAFKDEQNEDVREETLSALGTISSLEPALFQTVILPAILGMLPSQVSTEPTEKEAQTGAIISLLEYLIRISSSSTGNLQTRQANFAVMEGKLVRKLVEILPIADQQSYQHAILASISAWYEATAPDSTNPAAAVPTTQSSASHDQFAAIPFLLSHLVEVEGAGEHEHVRVKKSVDEHLVRFVGEYVMRSLRSQTTSQSVIKQWQESHIGAPSAVWSLFTPTEQPNLQAVQVNLVNAPESHTLAGALSMYLLAGATRDDIQTLKAGLNTGETAYAMIENAIAVNSQTSRFSRLCNLTFLQLLVNKFGAAKGPVGSSGKTLVELMIGKLEAVSSLSKAEAANTYQTLAYFAAASLASLDPSTKVLIQTMLDSLKDVKYGRKVAQSFRLLLAPSDILTKENSCTVRPLRKGRLYQLAVVPLITSWRTAQDPASKESSLLALTGVLSFLEPSMLADNAQDLIPVLLEGTNIQGDQFAKNACIKSILDLVPLAPKTIVEHVAAVIERMTDRTHNTYDSPSDSNVRGRAMALEVLAKLTEVVDATALIKRKPGLMRELDVALEDCSSEVRSKAERCKMAWFNLAEGE